MSNLLDIDELIDISSSSEEEGEIERASTPLPRDSQVNPRIIIEIPHSSAEATADDEEYLDLLLDSLETDCKRMKLSDSYTSFESVESGEYPHSTDSEEALADSKSSKRNNNYEQFQHQPFQFHQPGRAFRPMTVALSQSAPGLDCGCRRVGYGRGHGCTAKLANRYFRY